MTETAEISHAHPVLSEVRAGRYRLDPSHTRVLFSVSHFGFSTFYGEFVRPEGTLEFDPANVAGSMLRVAVPVASIQTMNATLDEELRSSDWLDSERYPTLTLAMTACGAQPDGSLRILAQMSLHGVTRQVLLEARFVGAGVNPKNERYTLGFDVRGKIRRSDFGVTAAPLIGDELTMIIGAAFELEADA